MNEHLRVKLTGIPVQNPLPRKGTETLAESVKVRQLGNGSKSITPQGDGNQIALRLLP